MEWLWKDGEVTDVERSWLRKRSWINTWMEVELMDGCMVYG